MKLREIPRLEDEFPEKLIETPIKTPSDAVTYAIQLNQRFPALEYLIASDFHTAYIYARDVVG